MQSLRQESEVRQIASVIDVEVLSRKDLSRACERSERDKVVLMPRDCHLDVIVYAKNVTGVCNPAMPQWASPKPV